MINLGSTTKFQSRLDQHQLKSSAVFKEKDQQVKNRSRFVVISSVIEAESFSFPGLQVAGYLAAKKQLSKNQFHISCGRSRFILFLNLMIRFYSLKLVTVG